MGEKMTPTLDGKLRCLQSLLQQMGASVACKTVGEARDALLTAHLTQPAQACEHDWAEGYGVPAYCKHCGVARVAQPAQAVDVGAILQVIAEMRGFRLNTPPNWNHLDAFADRLTAALPNANGKEDTPDAAR